MQKRDNNDSSRGITNYSTPQQSKTFPMIPDQIHKVPESIRKAIKIGKYRRNINFSTNNPHFSSSTNPTNIKINMNISENVYGGTGLLDSEQVNKKDNNQLQVRQIFGFLTAKGLEDVENNRKLSKNQQIFNYKQRAASGKQSIAKSYQSQGGSIGKANKVTNDRVLYARKKLSPLKKGLSVEPRGLATRDKRNFKVTFLNVQKLQLIKMYNNIGPNIVKQQQSSASKCYLNMTSSMGPFNQNNTQKQENIQVLEFSPNFRKSLYEKSPSKHKQKPFVPPFEKYPYRDFIWKCAFSYNIFHQSPQSYEQKFKVFIGGGNNSLLVKSIMKRRKGWWTFTDRYDQANLVWTQIKINVIFSNQKNQIARYEEIQSFCPQQKPRKIVTPAQKANLKILHKHQYTHWHQYFLKYRKAQDTLDQSMKKRNRIFASQKNKFTCKQLTKLDLKSLKMHNHLSNNYIIGNKKALYYTMSKYYQKIKQDVFQFLPLTFHIQNGLQDPQYLKFLNSYYQRAKKIRARQKNQNIENTIQVQQQQIEKNEPNSPSRVSSHNIWILKPGQFTNRGNGITVCMNLNQIKAILKKKQKHENGNYKTYIVQSYIQKPFLYQKRKFDLRHYMMITSINGIIKGYWYQYGYIRTTSFQYTTKHSLTSIHLTNDAVQKYLPEYGKYQKGNKISYQEFQKYLQKQYGDRYNFYQQIYPKMKKIATDSIKACSLMIDPEKKGHNFQIFGMDFMIDGDFHPWLIQINNNPCLQLSCPLLGQIIPPMVQNAIKICVDSVFPPPSVMPVEKKPFFGNDSLCSLQSNRFELVYNSYTEQQQLIKLFNGSLGLDLDYKQLQKDQDQVFDDDGIQLED